MIDKRFLFFQTKNSFERELGDGNINAQSIVFIKDIEAIWTHGTYFYCKCNEDEWVLGDNLPIILSDGWDTQPPQYIEVDQLLSATSKNPVWNKTIVEALSKKADDTKMMSQLNIVSNDLRSVISNLSANNNNTFDQIYRDIASVQNSIDNHVDTINEGIDDINDNIESIGRHVDGIDSSLNTVSSDITSLQQDVEQIKTHISSGNEIKHIILTEDEYRNLIEYESDTIYFVLPNWALKQNLPILLS